MRSGSPASRLVSRGALGLLQTVSASLYTMAATTKLSDDVTNTLNLANVDLASVLSEHGPSVRHWCPTIHDYILGQGAHLSLAMYPLLALGVWHVTMTTGAQAQLPHVSQLYQSLKQALALLQTKHEAEIEYLQWALSIAVYEVDRGLALPAFHTLSGCKSVLTMLGYDALDSGNE